MSLPAPGSRTRTARLLEEDPDLAADIDPRRRPLCEQLMQAEVLELLAARCDPLGGPESLRRGPGLLVLEGLVLRRIDLEGRFGAELIGAGELLRPWQREEATSITGRWEWRVLVRVRLALLDLGFASRTAPLPEISGALTGRALRRARAIVRRPKVLDRLHILLWHLADRWGTVTPARRARAPAAHPRDARRARRRAPTDGQRGVGRAPVQRDDALTARGPVRPRGPGRP
jgi:hypothetical protein